MIAATAGKRICGDPATTFAGIAIDSRAIGPGDLFAAIRGEVHDGHRFAADVVAGGCRGVVVETGRIDSLPADDWEKDGVLCVAVADTRRALGDLAAFHRSRCSAEVVAITGSNGKTSTRQMVVSVVSGLGQTLVPTSNFNNDIGVPLTLFNLHARHRLAVLELGMNHFGEIARLTEICRPDIGVITNVGPAHLEGVGSIEGVKAAKGELLEKMAPGRRAVLNADDPRVLELARGARQELLLFGTGPEAQVRAEEIRTAAGKVGFFLVLPSGRIAVTLNTPARFMVSNALAAAGVGHLLGLDPDRIRSGLEAFSPVKGRMTLIETGRGVTIVDDTYNANPGSMAGVIETLVHSAADRRILALGDMKELGEASESMHRDLGMAAAAAGLDRLCITGEFAGAVAEGAAAGGMAPEQLRLGAKPEIIDDLKRFVRPGDWVAVKGSRAAGMEEVVAGLLAFLGKKQRTEGGGQTTEDG